MVTLDTFCPLVAPIDVENPSVTRGLVVSWLSCIKMARQHFIHLIRVTARRHLSITLT